MTVSIRLDPSVWETGGVFEGVNPKKSVLVIGTGHPNAYVGKLTATYGPTSSLWRGSGQLGLNIDTVGTNITDINFEIMVKDNSFVQAAFLEQIIDFLTKGYIIVEQDGTALTPDQVRSFTAS